MRKALLHLWVLYMWNLSFDYFLNFKLWNYIVHLKWPYLPYSLNSSKNVWCLYTNAVFDISVAKIDSSKIWTNQMVEIRFQIWSAINFAVWRLVSACCPFEQKSCGPNLCVLITKQYIYLSKCDLSTRLNIHLLLFNKFRNQFLMKRERRTKRKK